MPIKKDKRKKKTTLLKQKQTQTQKVVINLADLVKKRPRAKPLVEPKAKKPSEMILTRIIREPAFTPPYQHHATEPVKLTHAGLAQPQYIPETYKPIVNQQLIEKMGQQPRPFHRSQDIEVAEANIHPILQAEPLRQRKPRATKAEMEARRITKELEDELKNAEMERRRENERQLMKKGGYKSQEEE